MSEPIDPNGPAEGDGLFGLDVAPESAAAVVVPVPFDATSSYRQGAALGPAAILAASHQVELVDVEFGAPYERGIALLETDPRIAAWNEEARGATVERVNAIGERVNELVHAAVDPVLERGALPVVLGGDHSVPFGAWLAASARHGRLGLLHFDAHADLRKAYEGYAWSHASILFNGMTRLGLRDVVQVGVRDLCPEERARIEELGVYTVFDYEWAREGGAELVRDALARLPDEVWVTFDVDGLDPTLCPSTGTPVPGGLSWHDAALWLRELARSGRRVVGVDLVEVAPGDPARLGEGYDENVGARLLYRLIATAFATR